jgi:hypothetical protein
VGIIEKKRAEGKNYKLADLSIRVLTFDVMIKKAAVRGRIKEGMKNSFRNLFVLVNAAGNKLDLKHTFLLFVTDPLNFR